MLSPKMQRTIRVNDNQLIMLSERAHYDHSQAGYLHKRSADCSKWQLRWFVLYQNLLFYYDSEHCHRPSGILLLEGCYCERLITTGSASKTKDGSDRQYCFAISYRKDNIRQYELRALNEMDCKNWIEAIREASFNKLLLQKEELEQKHLHLLQIIESEKTAKWQYTQQCEDLASEIKKLRAEKEWKPATIHQSTSSLVSTQGTSSSTVSGQFANLDQDSIELRKIKKVQSFFRGWLCRRRWKQIVEQYIKSPHAESMRKRNSLVFRMVEAEEEYMEQMEVLVACFLRPFKMAASSKKPPCLHEDVNSIFLNSETVLFLHQIFLKGLTSRLESWPTLVLGDLFSMLVPMLSIYQEYVRNHHYSLQVLTECKQSPQFSALLKRLESKPACHGRSLETFLTYPMHQVPRYIITLHELLAHTPHDHVERKSLQNARQQLEDLSRQMHDEVSETENLRKNLAVERMIVEGCDILLDVNQVFVRQGSLIQLPGEKAKTSRSKLNFKSEREYLRQCFLFSNHLIIATRTSSGKLHLVPDIGKIPLADALLIEDPSETQEDEEASVCSVSSQSSGMSETSGVPGSLHNRDFKIFVEQKTGNTSQQLVVHLLASSVQEKAAWISDISQCLDNVQFNDIIRPTALSDNSSISLPQCLKNDPKLFKDEADIRFSRTLNSCKVPQIRYATPERLLQRLTDLRFLSIDFLNTFLLTYRVFTDGVTVLEALKRVFYSNEPEPQGSVISLEGLKDEHTIHSYDDRRRSSFSPRRTSGASSVSGYGSEMSERDRSHSYDSQGHRHWKSTLAKYEEEKAQEVAAHSKMARQSSPTKSAQKTSDTLSPPSQKMVSIRVEKSKDSDSRHLTIPTSKVAASSSSDTLTEATVLSAPCSPSNLSSVTLVASSPSDSNNAQETGGSISPRSPTHTKDTPSVKEPPHKEPPPVVREVTPKSDVQRKTSATKHEGPVDKRLERCISEDSEETQEDLTLFYNTVHRASTSSSRSASISTAACAALHSYYGIRRSMQEGDSTSTARSSFQHDSPQKPSKAGVVITSFRQSKRRSSTSSAAAAFAIAVSGSSNPRDISPSQAKEQVQDEFAERARYKENIISTACTMRVLNVLRHWISKHPQDFENDQRLKNMTIEFLDDIIYSPNLLPAEHKSAAQLLRLLTKEDAEGSKIDIGTLLSAPSTPSKESIETLSALEIAEQLTYIDHQIFIAISSEEFLGQAWMKNDKNSRAPHILMMTRRFNDVSRLVASEIVRRTTISTRVAAIEKWAAVADICRCLHNFNGVLQICSAFTNSSVFRLKKTWDKVSKTTKQTIEKLQNIVSSDGRFRSLRDALHRCDPPCIPYLGMYLTDLSFIEEGTPNFTAENLLNFSKMRMIAHVIREIRHFQLTSYKIELIRKVTSYLLDSSLLMDDEELYSTSLEIEPRTSRLTSSALHHQLSLSKC
ncbi:ras-specific guanine nucleotide-releasing factor 2-like isoform X3 [Coccinella septempunctata]|uniref:ras-specific guanine nucleotide-releasing factor 2-like isoform X3 n=1 Tax=Coccinella septempunctata TaxID=41139 RepID=UPI001D08D526|nr:ras-specific guanine nucleotide-releasing factor 2-like isoform X3 [Coccinella septempunctata]